MADRRERLTGAAVYAAIIALAGAVAAWDGRNGESVSSLLIGFVVGAVVFYRAWPALEDGWRKARSYSLALQIGFLALAVFVSLFGPRLIVWLTGWDERAVGVVVALVFIVATATIARMHRDRMLHQTRSSRS